MPTKTKKNPVVELSNRLRVIMCDRVAEVMEETQTPMIPNDKYDFLIALSKCTRAWKKMGIVYEEMEPFYGVEFATEMVAFSNKNQGCVLVLLVSDEQYDEEMQLGSEGEGQMEGIPLCAVPLALAQKIVKKGSI